MLARLGIEALVLRLLTQIQHIACVLPVNIIQVET